MLPTIVTGVVGSSWLPRNTATRLGRFTKRRGRKPPSKNTEKFFKGTRKARITGKPDLDYVSTSYVERQNLTMRMTMRRFTRLTNAFSKKAENLAHAVALHFMHYNFCRVHQSLRVTPAMETGITDHVWSIEEIMGLLK